MGAGFFDLLAGGRASAVAVVPAAGFVDLAGGLGVFTGVLPPATVGFVDLVGGSSDAAAVGFSDLIGGAAGAVPFVPVIPAPSGGGPGGYIPCDLPIWTMQQFEEWLADKNAPKEPTRRRQPSKRIYRRTPAAKRHKMPHIAQVTPHEDEEDEAGEVEHRKTVLVPMDQPWWRAWWFGAGLLTLAGLAIVLWSPALSGERRTRVVQSNPRKRVAKPRPARRMGRISSRSTRGIGSAHSS